MTILAVLDEKVEVYLALSRDSEKVRKVPKVPLLLFSPLCAKWNKVKNRSVKKAGSRSGQVTPFGTTFDRAMTTGPQFSKVSQTLGTWRVKGSRTRIIRFVPRCFRIHFS